MSNQRKKDVRRAGPATAVPVESLHKVNACRIQDRELCNLPLPSCGKAAFHDDVVSVALIAERLVALLNARGLDCATAESCTGGGVGSAITSVPGSSSVFAGGVISYANEVKRDVLGVPESVLAEKGAVSSECAAAMAMGVRRLLNVDVAVSLTGIAGPGGGSAEKPVGLVWFGIATAYGARTERVIFSGDRARIRAAAVVHALGMLTIAAMAPGTAT